jgi:hypothetical protein
MAESLVSVQTFSHSGIQAPHYTENVCTDTNLHRNCVYRHQPLRHPGPTLQRKCLHRHQLTQKMFVQTPTTQPVCTNMFCVMWGLGGWVVGVCTNIFCVSWCLCKHFLCNVGPGCLSGWCLYTQFLCKYSATQVPHYTENVCTDTSHPGPTLHRKCLYKHQPLRHPKTRCLPLC